MALNLSFRVPRPQRFLFLLSLSNANTLLLYLFLLNKASAIYGLLSRLTGAPLSSLQATMYIYSIIVLAGVLFYLAPRIRFSGSSPLSPDPFRTLLWGYVYAIDTVVNAFYTTVFAFLWFLEIATTEAAAEGGEGVEAPLDIGKSLFQNGSIASIVTIVFLWILRFYSVFVVLSYTRLVIRHHIAINSITSGGGVDVHSHPMADVADDPFRIGTDAGEGWEGRLGRVLIRFGRSYWLGKDASSMGSSDLESGPASVWLNNLSRKLAGQTVKGSSAQAIPLTALEERERRRRSGTGPPKPTGLHIDTHARIQTVEA